MAITTLGDNFRVIIEGGSGARFAGLAEASADVAVAAAGRSEDARDIAQAAVGVDYADATAALTGASNGDKFTYWDGDEIVYSTKTGGVLVELTGPWFGADKVTYQRGGSPAVRTLPEKLGDIISVADYRLGSDTDDTASFQRAIAKLNTVSHSVELLVGGNLTVAGSLDPIVTPRKIINGWGATINHDGGTLFSFNAGGNVGGIHGIRYICPSTPIAGTCLAALDGAIALSVSGITGQINEFLKAGLTDFAGGYSIENVNVNTVNAAMTVIKHGDGANSRLRNVVMTAIGTSRLLDQTTPSGALATAVSFGAGGWDTIDWDGLLWNGFETALDMTRVVFAKNISNAMISNFIFDYCAKGMNLENVAAGGGINNMIFRSGWVVGMDGHGVHLKGTVGDHRDIQFDGVHALLAGSNNWRLEAAAMSGVELNNCRGKYANRLNGSNTGNLQDDFVALYGGWAINGGQYGRSANNIVIGSAPNWQGRYGVNVAPNIADWRVEGARMEGKTADTSMNIASTTVLSGNNKSAFVRNNSVIGGALSPAYATSTTVAAPTSGALQTNNTPFTFDLYIYGGAVTLINLNGTQVSDTVPAQLTVKPGYTWQLNYTVAPTLRRIIHP